MKKKLMPLAVGAAVGDYCSKHKCTSTMMALVRCSFTRSTLRKTEQHQRQLTNTTLSC